MVGVGARDDDDEKSESPSVVCDDDNEDWESFGGENEGLTPNSNREFGVGRD